MIPVLTPTRQRSGSAGLLTTGVLCLHLLTGGILTASGKQLTPSPPSAAADPGLHTLLIDPAGGILPDQQLILTGSSNLEIDNPAIQQELLGRSGREWVWRLSYPEGTAPFSVRALHDAEPIRDLNLTQPCELPEDPLFRLAVAEDGIYRVSYRELQEAGLTAGMLSDPDRIGLFANGQQQPLRVIGDEDGLFNPGDALEFPGEAPRAQLENGGSDLYHDPWSPWNIYYLYESPVPPLRMIEESGEIVAVDPHSYFHVSYFTTISRFEEDNYFDRLVVVDSEQELDHFFFDDGVRAWETAEYDFSLPGFWSSSPRPVHIAVGLRGQSFSTADNPTAGVHRAQIHLNNRTRPELDAGAPVGGEYLWQEQEYIEIGIDASAPEPFYSNLLSEENTLMLEVLGDTPAGGDNRVLLDYFSVSYQRDLTARDDQLLLTLDPADGIPSGELLDIVVEGFSSDDIVIYRDDGSFLTNAEIRPLGANSFRCHFQDEIQVPTSYYVMTTSQLKPVAELTAVAPFETPGLTPSTAGCDYLVIVADSLLSEGSSDSLQIWLENHPGDFGNHLILPASRVYDWFSYGRFSPYAIRDLLAYGLHYWDRFPRYLLLAGDGSDNARRDLERGVPLLPVKFRHALNWGATATEHWFGQLTQDLYPDVLVGRLPASSAAGMNAVLSKLISYQQAEGGRWQNRLLFASGIGGVGDLAFSQQTATLIQGWIPQHYFVERLLTDDFFSPFFGGTEQLLDYLDQGMVLVNYTGHGGGAVWSDNNLFRDEDVYRLENGTTLPFITNFTCYINAFESGTTLGEELLIAAERGAIGTLGCTSLSFFLTGNEFAQYFYRSLLAGEQQPVGEAVFHSSATFLSLYADDIAADNEHGQIINSTLNSLNILGDPAQQLHLPAVGDPPALLPSVGLPGETMGGSWSTTPECETAQLRFYSQTSWPLLRGPSPLYHVAEDPLQPGSAGEFSLATAFPDSCPGGSPGQVRLVSWSQDPADAVSAGTFFFYADSLDTPYVWGTGTVPQEVNSTTQFYFEASCAAAEPLQQISLDLSVIDTLDQLSEQFSEILLPEAENRDRYRGAVEYGPYPAGYTLSYFFITEDAEGELDTTTTSWQPVLPLLPDPLLGPVFNSPAAGGGLRLSLANQGNAAAENVPLHLSLSGDSLTWDLTSVLIVPWLGVACDTMVQFDLPATDYRWLLFELDPDSLLADADRTNNRQLLAVDRRYYGVNSELGTHDGSAHAVIQLDAQTFLEILPEEMPPGISGVLEVSLNEEDLPQPDLSSALPLYRVEPVDMVAEIPLHWSWQLPGYDQELPELALVDRWQNLWLRCEPLTTHTGDTLRLEAITDMICGVVPGQAEDSEPPGLEVSVENQVFTTGGFVSRRPTFTVHASDLNGIDVSPEMLTATINDVSLAENEIHFDAAGELSGAGVALKPDLTMLSPDSVHQLTVGLQDLCGNRDSVTTQFRIATSLSIEYFGNYPNPFEDETLFIFNLTDLTDRIELDIFTTSGRLIRRLGREGPLINYAEIHWDGRDEEYRAVANGVYFYRITAWQGEEQVSCTGKAARIR